MAEGVSQFGISLTILSIRCLSRHLRARGPRGLLFLPSCICMLVRASSSSSCSSRYSSSRIMASSSSMSSLYYSNTTPDFLYMLIFSNSSMPRSSFWDLPSSWSLPMFSIYRCWYFIAVSCKKYWKFLVTSFILIIRPRLWSCPLVVTQLFWCLRTCSTTIW